MAGWKRSKRSKSGPTTAIAARVDADTFELIDAAALIREVDRQEILIAGGKKEALRILRHSVKAIRRHKDRQRRARNAARRARLDTGKS